MFPAVAILSFSLFFFACGQQVGTNMAEIHPKISWQTCTKGGGCQNQSVGSVVLDSNWRSVHTVGGFTNCYTGNTWNTAICPDDVTCAKNCALDGADYSGTYGITTSGNALTLKFVTTGAQKNIGSRVYLLASDTNYQMFKFLNQEFSFDVDVSNLPCGLNGALYFSQMDADGGLARFPTNKAGAKYGTGYCDSQCPTNLKFINGEANAAGWAPSSNDATAGTGGFGSCCNEMDVWEANSVATTFAPHPCTVQGQTRCTGTACGGPSNRYGSACDPDGCDFNSFRMGDKTFYGKGMTIDTSSKFTVVTQFLTSNNSTTGTLSEIRRLYVQNGKVIQNSKVNIPGMAPSDSVTDGFCAMQKSVFGDATSFQSKGGLTAVGQAFAKGGVLVMSIGDDHANNMLWLDSNYPTTSSPSSPGVARGACSITSGVPATVEASAASASVTFSNIKFGDIGSTYNAPSSGGPVHVPKFGQCGGQGWAGPTVCAPGTTCTVLDPFLNECL